MVDIETMGTSPSAPILSIGAAHFDECGEDSPDSLEAFETVISLKSNEKAGRVAEADTIGWWLNQSKDAQNALLSRQVTSLEHGLKEFVRWIGVLSPKPITLWAKDPDFDVVILRSAFDHFGLMFPFKYYQHRSVRTIYATAWRDTKPPRVDCGEKHTAKTDAIEQSLVVQLAHLKLLG
jgi:exodeoxyribonuclease VIII